MQDKANIYQPEKEQEESVSKNTHQVDEIDKEVEKRREEIDKKVAEMPKEYGGRTKEKGLEPTRYNDWELKGRCIDF